MLVGLTVDEKRLVLLRVGEKDAPRRQVIQRRAERIAVGAAVKVASVRNLFRLNVSRCADDMTI